jgi:hypothetical protein
MKIEINLDKVKLIQMKLELKKNVFALGVNTSPFGVLL